MQTDIRDDVFMNDGYGDDHKTSRQNIDYHDTNSDRQRNGQAQREGGDNHGSIFASSSAR